MIDRLIYYFLG